MTFQTILVYVGEDLLGDAILKLPFVYALRHQFPKVHITWFAGAGNSMYATQLQDLIAHKIDAIQHDLRLVEHRPSSLFPNQHFDLIIDTQRDISITWRLKRLPHTHFLSRTWRGIFSTLKPPSGTGHLLNRLFSLVSPITDLNKAPPFGLDLPSIYQEKWASYFSSPHPYIGLAPGAGNRERCWPLDSFITLVKIYEGTFLTPVFILGPNEKEWEMSLRHQFPQALFPLQDHPEALSSPLYTTGLGYYLKGAIVNDAGVAHLLGMSPTHLISLFGPTPSHKSHPHTSRLTLIRAQDFGGRRMRHIPVEAVKKALDQVV